MNALFDSIPALVRAALVVRRIWPHHESMFGTLAAGFGTAGALVFAAHRRKQKAPRSSVTPDTPRTKIEDLREGRHQIVGTVRSVKPTPSLVDDLPCAFVERVEYRSYGGSIRKEEEHVAIAPPCLLSDGTGEVWVDLSRAEIEGSTVSSAGGAIVEYRVREGEEVVVQADFERTERESLEGLEADPYRSAERVWNASTRSSTPSVSVRTVDIEYRRPDDIRLFLLGAAGLITAATLFLAGLELAMNAQPASLPSAQTFIHSAPLE